MTAVERGDTGPISEELKRDPSTGRGREEIAAFAISTQGLTVLTAGLPKALPGALSDFLIEEDLLGRARARRLQETLCETVLCLRATGVEVVALKGATLAFFHYPDPALRPMGDLDLLLRDPRDLERATAALVGGGWTALFDTPRHRVFARPDERVASPATEHPENPLRLELHTSFRLPVLGRVFDASADLRTQAEVRDLAGAPVVIAAGSAFLRHLLFHAAEDFAGKGIRGIQAHDFRLLARKAGVPLAPQIRRNSESSENSGISSNERERGQARGTTPLLYAADAIERLFPLTFEEVFLSSLSSRVDPVFRRRAATLPPLRYTRPARGWTRTLLPLIDGPVHRARFLARTLFPAPGEIRANVAIGSSRVGLLFVYVKLILRRIGVLLH